MAVIELELGNKADLLVIGKKAMAEKKEGNTNASKTTLSQNDKIDSQPPAKINTQKELAKAAGVSTGQIGMAENENFDTVTKVCPTIPTASWK